MSTGIMKELDRKILSDHLNKRVFKFAEGSSKKIFLVGGYIRDLFLGIEKKDRDFVLKGRGAREMARRMAEFLDGSFVDLDEERDFARVVINGAYLDFTGTLGKSIDEDLKRRDFTINSIAWSPLTGLIDPLNGIGDIQKGIIRAISKENLKEDPLRILRAYRIASELKMDIEKKTSGLINELSYLLPNVSGERISFELFRILNSPQSFGHVLMASEAGVLEAIFPELIKTKDIPPYGKHHLSVFYHSLETLKSLESVALRLPDWVMDYFREEIACGISRFSVLKLAGILHDIGKPLTLSVTEEGKYRFIDHEKAGAELIEKTAERLKTSADIKEMLKVLVEEHLRPLQLIESGFPDQKSILRFLRSLKKYSTDITVLSIADILSMADPEKDNDENIRLLLEILERGRDFKKLESESPKLLNGKEIMQITGIGPGPEIGRILAALREAQHLGEVKDKEDAIKSVKKMNIRI